LRFNQATVASVGSDASKTNLGTLTVRVAGAGATRGYIAAGEGISRIASYTIPAGHRLFVQSQSVVQAKSGGQGTTIALASYATLASGAMLLASDNTYPEGVSDVTWPSGIRLQEKQTLEFRVNAISTSGIDVGILLVGILADLDNLAWFSPANALR
jgi:hypothetical protein